MRVLHVVPTYWPAVRYGGPIFSIHALCRAMARQGDEVSVFTTNVDGAGVLDVNVGQEIDVDGVRVTYFEAGRPRRLYRSPEMGRALGDGVAEFDFVHLHSTFLWPTLAAARAAQRACVPYALSPRGMLSPALIRERGWLRKSAWIGLFEQRTLAAASFVHATSDLEARELSWLGVDRSRVVVLPNGVALEPEASGALPEGLAPGAYMLYLGRISWKKGLVDLIESLRAGPRVPLVLAGPDDEGLASELLATAAKHGQDVRFVGSVHRGDKVELLRGARCVVLPSHGENFGNVVLEAMAVGRPVLCTEAVGAAEIVDRAGAGFVCPVGVIGLTGALQELSRASAEDLLAMGARGQREVIEHHTWDSVARRMHSAYVGATANPIHRGAA